MLDTSVKNLMFDLGTGRDIYDSEANRAISKIDYSIDAIYFTYFIEVFSCFIIRVYC